VTDVPLYDPRAEYRELGAEVDSAVHRVVRSGRFVGGPEVEGFESELGERLEGRAVAGVGSGTDALRLALIGLGVNPGSEVILPANTFTATAMAVESVGAVPVLSDVDPDLHVVTPELIEPLLNAETAAIVPVHLYGQPAPMASLVALAAAHGVPVIEDAAQALGSTVEGRPVGVHGTAAAFSFYPSKNLGAYGDAGAVACGPDLRERLLTLRDLGRDPAGSHVTLGSNSRLDALQAAILRAKLPHLDGWVARRRALAARYRELLAQVPLELPVEAGWGTHSFHLFVIRLAGRDRVRGALAASGIETGIHYPVPIHLQPAHRGRVRVPFAPAVAERLAAEILSLPLYPQMTHAQQDRVVAELARARAAA
jgi:dTDP-3-amino-3,4,6-trideoxy-alpha-D-glucose transaminase